MVARLAFVVVFENVIVMLTSMTRLLIPDVPKEIREQRKQHSYITNELIMKHEFMNSKDIRVTVDRSAGFVGSSNTVPLLSTS